MPTLAAILATVVLPRLAMLQVSVIDWDESIYALIGQQWVAGHVPHETVFDHKPIALYGIFASFFIAFGDTIQAIRLIPIVFVAATSLLLARLAQDRVTGDSTLCWIAAALYGLLTLANGGLATNTEILVNFFVVLSVYLIVTRDLDRRTSFPASLAAGASLGLAFQVNYLSGILLVGVAGFYLTWLASYRPATGLLRRLSVNGAWILGGFLLVSVLVHVPVLVYGDLSDYFELKLRYLTGYQGVEAPGVALRRVSEALGPYWPFYTLALLLAVPAFGRSGPSRWSWFTGESPLDRRVTAWLILGAAALIAAFASRRFYQHFFLFSVPALVMLATAFLRLGFPPGRLRRFCAFWMVLMAGVALIAARDEFLRGLRAHARVLHGEPADNIAESAKYLARRLGPGETIYVHDGQPILYFMTRTVPLTRFAFPDTHLKEEVAGRLGFRPVDAVSAILQRKPRFIIAGPRPDDAVAPRASILLHEVLERQYAPARAKVGDAPGGIYERIEAPGDAAD
jgi:4-amino-4-deoxy-L-arabinose transferase-like glycosyltransferase